MEETSVVRLVGRYQIVSELGRGTMGIVFKGFDPTIGRTVALKTIAFAAHDDEAREFRRRLHGEAAAAGVLNHPNIVTIYDVVEDGPTMAIAMEFIEGQTLAAMIRKGPLTLDRALALFEPICSALDYAGSRGIIHRDVKPANIIVSPDGTPKIADFGLARAPASTATKSGVIVGSPGYMSPEQVRGKKLDRRSDLFSAAAMFYEMVTNDRPFDGDDTASLMYHIVHERHRPAHHLNPTLAPDVGAVLDRALAKDPDDRFATGAELVAALRAAVAQPPWASRVKSRPELQSQSLETLSDSSWDLLRDREPAPTGSVSASAGHAEPPARARRVWIAPAVLVVAAAAAVGVIVMRGPGRVLLEPNRSVPAPVAQPAPAAAPESTPAPLPSAGPQAPVALAAPISASPPARQSGTSALAVQFSGQTYPVVLYAGDTQLGRLDRNGSLSLDSGDVRIRAVGESVFLNQDFGTMSLRPDERKALTLPDLASAVIGVRGDAYVGVKIEVDGRLIPGPYPAQLPRIAASQHVVRISWVTGALAGREVRRPFDARAGGHVLVRALPEDGEITVQRIRR